MECSSHAATATEATICDTRLLLIASGGNKGKENYVLLQILLYVDVFLQVISFVFCSFDRAAECTTYFRSPSRCTVTW